MPSIWTGWIGACDDAKLLGEIEELLSEIVWSAEVDLLHFDDDLRGQHYGLTCQRGMAQC